MSQLLIRTYFWHSEYKNTHEWLCRHLVQENVWAGQRCDHHCGESSRPCLVCGRYTMGVHFLPSSLPVLFPFFFSLPPFLFIASSVFCSNTLNECFLCGVVQGVGETAHSSQILVSNEKKKIKTCFQNSTVEMSPSCFRSSDLAVGCWVWQEGLPLLVP